MDFWDETAVLVTGGAGFIGSHLVEALIRHGARVTVVDNLSTGRVENLPHGVAFYNLDIANPEIENVVQVARPELIFHLAAQSAVSRSVEDPRGDAVTNVLGTLNLLSACVEGRVRKVVFASSGGTVYGETAGIAAGEDMPTRPLSPYGITKLAGELYLDHYHREHGLPYVALRLANVYGPRQDPTGEAGVVAKFLDSMLAGRPPTIFGDGTCVRDYVHVHDVVNAFLLAGGSEVTGAFNVATGVGTTVNELFATMASIVGFQDQPVYGPPRPGDLQYSVLDPTRARDALGWVSTVGLPEGLAMTLASWPGYKMGR